MLPVGLEICFLLSKLKLLKSNQPHSPAPAAGGPRGNRGKPREEAPLAPANIDLNGLSNEQLKQLWLKHKRQTERIHAAWIKALNYNNK